MNPKMMHHYNQELQHLREMGGEFAREFPKIAGRLGLEGFDCADPYVERLLEGFSFLAARVHLRIDSEYPTFTQHLLEMIYPSYLAPTPSMAVVQIQPDISNPNLASGFKVPRGSGLRSLLGKMDATACEYRTAHEVTLWPIEIAKASFFTHSGDLGGGASLPVGTKAGIRIRLRACGSLPFKDLPIDKLRLFLRGADEMPMRLLEQIIGHNLGALILPNPRSANWHSLLPAAAIAMAGFLEEEALLPVAKRSFDGYRILREYFSFPSRFCFVDVSGLKSSFERCAESEIDLIILLDKTDSQLERSFDESNLALNCTPVINLFTKRTDRIQITSEVHEHHLVVDRTRPMDFEVYQIEDMTGYASGPGLEQPFQPFYAAKDLGTGAEDSAFYQIRREKRMISERQRRQGPRSSYLGSETFVSLVDGKAAPYRRELRQIGVSALVTNRDLPLSMPIGVGKTDFTLESGAPVESVRCVAGPTSPNPSYAEGDFSWRLINHLSLNYLSLTNIDEKQGAKPFRDLLSLYCQPDDSVALRQIEGLRSVTASSITRRLPMPGPITFGRGLQVTAQIDESAFVGAGTFLFGAVLDRFIAQYVPINTFSETVIKTLSRGEIMRWPSREGVCRIF